MEWTNLSQDEHAQFMQEAANLSGTNDNSATTDVDAEATDNSEEVTTTDEGTEEETDVKESKHEKKIKKLLSKKNQAEHEKDELLETVRQLKQESETNRFHAEHPEAMEHSDKIDALLETKPWMDRADAYYLLQGRGEIQTKATNNKFTGRSATGLSTPKDPMKGTTSDMESYLKDNFWAWGFNNLI